MVPINVVQTLLQIHEKEVKISLGKDFFVGIWCGAYSWIIFHFWHRMPAIDCSLLRMITIYKQEVIDFANSIEFEKRVQRHV